MRIAITVLGVSLAAAACAPRPAPAPATPAPLPVAGRDWHFHADGDTAMLAYGVEASDELNIRFDCQAGSGRTDILQPAARAAAEIRLESGGETERLRARAEPSDLDDSVLLLAEAPVSAPVFTRFRQLGWLAIDDDGTRRALAAHPDSDARVERYFKVCE
jgi:hypothetical protein